MEDREVSDEKVNLVKEFFKEVKGIDLTEREIRNKFNNVPETLSDDFKTINKNEKEMKEYYCKEDYIFDLVAANDWSLFIERTKFTIEICKDNKAKNIIDYGAGCGFSCLEFAKAQFEVTYVDYKGATWEFAEWLFKREKVNVRMITPDEYFSEDKLYDITYSNDVLEHILHLGRTIIKMAESTKVACILFYCFSKEGNFSQHIHLMPNAGIYLHTLMRMHGFNSHEKVINNLFIKKPYYGYYPEGLKWKAKYL